MASEPISDPSKLQFMKSSHGVLSVWRADRCGGSARVGMHTEDPCGYYVERPGEAVGTYLRPADGPATPPRRDEFWGTRLRRPEALAYAADALARAWAPRTSLLPLPAANIDSRSWFGAITDVSNLAAQWVSDGTLAFRRDGMGRRRAMLRSMDIRRTDEDYGGKPPRRDADVEKVIDARTPTDATSRVRLLGCAQSKAGTVALLDVAEGHRMMAVSARKLALIAAAVEGGLVGMEASWVDERAALIWRRRGVVVAALMPFDRAAGPDVPTHRDVLSGKVAALAESAT